MGSREIPDSDPYIPELNLDSPAWVGLGDSYLDFNGSPSKDNSKQTIIPNASEDFEVRHDSPSSNHSEEVEQQQAVDTASTVDSNNDQAHRRRRFNFQEWVEEDRKTHEYVYRKRFRTFHGALSDSEDEDYGELQGGGEDPIPEINDGDSASSDSEATGIEETDARIIRRRRGIIDSDSESEPNDEAEVGFVLERMLTKSIPAVTRKPVTQESEVLDDPQESLESSLELSQEFARGESGEDILASLDNRIWGTGEAREDRSGIDFMPALRPSRNSGPVKPRQPKNVVSLAESKKAKASRPVRVAARTARSTRKRPQQQAGAQPFKFNRTPVRDRNSRTQISGSLGKLFVNQSDETMHTLRRMDHEPAEEPRLPAMREKKDRQTKISNFGTLQPLRSSRRLIGAQTGSVNANRKRKAELRPRKPAKTRRMHSHSFFSRTSIIEIPQQKPLSKLPMMTPPKHSMSSPAREEKPNASVSYNRPSKELYTESEVSHGPLLSEVTLSHASEFSTATFLGSNIAELLERPCISNAQSICPNKTHLQTSMNEASSSSIVRDSALILQLCENGLVDATLYDEIYDYFLLGASHLIDESQILEEGFLKFVRDEWLRLARKLLKTSIRQNWVSRSSRNLPLLCSEVVIVAVVLVHARLCITTQSSSKSTKISQLFAWATFYHQAAISRQLTLTSGLNGRQRSGVELVYFGFKVCGLEMMPHVLERSQNSKASWHTVELLAAINSSWSDWELARKVLALDIKEKRSIRVAMDHIQRLLSTWGWRGSPEMVTDLFVYYTKQQSYADPRGESIWLPEFLLTSKFDGSNYPHQDFSMFLELLGFTLRVLKDDLKNCLRLAGRVTPLSALTFPEDKEVSLADLSSASHQYGTLIVLARMLDGKHRPSVSQFRDLVILKNAHWAIRVKAVSAWSILVRLGTAADMHECRLWMNEDIFHGDNAPDLLVQVALKSCSEVLPQMIEGVPWQRLLELGFRGSNAKTRNLAWSMCEKISDRVSPCHLIQIFASLKHITDTDTDRLAQFFGNGHISSLVELYEAQKVPLELTKVLVTRMLERRCIETNEERAMLHPVVLESLLSRDLTQTDRNLMAAASIPVDFMSRHTTLRSFMSQVNITEREWRRVLQVTGENVVSTNDPSYHSLVEEVRRLAIIEHPNMLKDFPVVKGQFMSDAETMQQNIMNFVFKKDVSCFYYLAYRLRRSSSDLAPNMPNILDYDVQIIGNLINSVIMSKAGSSVLTSNVLINYIFASFFDLASKVYSRTLKSQVSFALPTIVKCAMANMGRAIKLEFGCQRLLYHATSYLECRMRLDRMVMAHFPTVYLLSMVCELAIMWFSQSRNSELKDKQFCTTILSMAKRALAALKSPQTTLIWSDCDLALQVSDLPEEFSAYPALNDVELLSAFQCDEPDKMKSNSDSRSKAKNRVSALIKHCEVYYQWCET